MPLIIARKPLLIRARDWLDRWVERHLGEHLNLGPVTIYGCNAMHFAVNVYTSRWGYLCFRPTTWHMGRWWRWYFYISRDGTPCDPCCTYRIGPGLKD